MVIESYNVTAQAQRSYLKVERQTLSASTWGPGGQTERTTGGQLDGVSLSDWAKEQLAQLKDQSQPALVAANATGDSGGAGAPAMTKDELKLRLLDSMLISLTGKRLNPTIYAIMKGGTGRNSGMSLFGNGGAGLRFMNGGGVAIGSGARITTKLNYEREAVSYNAQGVIKTGDGKTINVDVQMQMSREFLEYSSTTMEFGRPQNCVDPLMINYAGTAASLTGEKFSFDLDADGKLDQISFAGAGSGFLALDRNSDGKINDGTELFGANTGNGFEELRGYDKDKNGWIDENDAVFNQLRIWAKDKDGADRLFTLQELGIGAIYLGDVSTQFSLTDSAGNAQGTMRSTSFFLKENGGAGTISHIDLTV